MTAPVPGAVRRQYPDTFQAIWPIVTARLPHELIAEARRDLPNVLSRHHAEVATEHGRFRFARGADIPGAEHIGDELVVYTAPGRRMPPRPYHRS